MEKFTRAGWCYFEFNNFERVLKINPIFALLAAGAVFLSAIAFTTSDKSPGKSNLRGIILATLSALGFGLVAVIQKYVTAQSGVFTQQVVWSFSILISLFIFLLLKGKNSKII